MSVLCLSAAECAASVHTEVNMSSGISHTGLGATVGLGVAIL